MEPQRKQSPTTLILLIVCVGQCMVGLDQRALLVALPTLTDSFNTDLTTIQWVLLIYDLMLIGSVITVGRLGDLLGRRRLYSSGFVVFVSASALCGLSQTPVQLIICRALQAVGGSMIVANGRAIASVSLPQEQRGKALGLISMAFHVGFLTGPTLGGFLIDTVGWRWIFYINLPVGLWGARLAWKTIEETKEDLEHVSIDFSGAFLLLLTNSLFIYGMSQLPHVGWHDPVAIGTLALAGAALFVFVMAELRSQAPILSFSLFRSRLFTASMFSLFFITSTQAAISFLIPFYLQMIRGFSPAQMGWIIIASSVVIIIVAPFAGWLSDRLGSRLLCTTGSFVIVVGQFFIASLNASSSIARIVLPIALSGFGWAIFNAPNQSAIFGSVPREKVGVASGMNTTTARTGGAMGVALAATLFTYGLAAAGLTPAQIESPQSWGTTPHIFIRSFNHTVHIVNFFTLLSVFFSAVRGTRHE